jgi:tryptophan synthase alpha chain
MTNRIDKTLREAREAGRPILAPFMTVGYPDLDSSVEIAEAILQSGADLIELGVPFSDPLAEGPTIQMSSQHALRQGITLQGCISAVRRLRKREPDAPVLLMGYYNPFLRPGLERFVEEAADAGVDGLIVPDLPPEEAGPLHEICLRHGVHLVPLLAPTSTTDRIKQACQYAGGFIYCVSLMGVTGARTGLREGLADFVDSIRNETDLPILVGFGISTPAHVKEVSGFADGAIVGSALIDAIAAVPKAQAVQAAREFVTAMRRGAHA